MSATDIELVRHRMRRAAETLEEARSLFRDGFTAGVVNRTYYACFYAVNALLLSEGVASAKHSGVRALFNQRWIRTSRLPAEMGDIYNQLFERRQAGDYKDVFSFERGDVGTWLKDAEAFISRISDCLRDTAGIEQAT